MRLFVAPRRFRLPFLEVRGINFPTSRLSAEDHRQVEGASTVGRRLPAVAYRFPKESVATKGGFECRDEMSVFRYELGMRLRAHNLLCENE